MKTKDLTQIALTIAVIIVLGLIPAIPLGIIPVPIVLQNMGIMLAGFLLGPKKGTISVAIFLLLVALGMPILTGGNGGMAVFVGPTSGYLIGWLFTPLIIFILNNLAKKMPNKLLYYLIIWLLILVVDLIGSIGLSLQSGMQIKIAVLSNLIFIPGDTIKLFISIILTQKIKKFV
ncbi:biotin transporter BioY [Apilactobacillus sp. TMW 2.2459]|uniref:biotin transporter BioY n=1 Tax=Apilactobacillus xinyiensis TaxID=2841032 RepID=UPI0020109248|nr:biotin transporter BioY [Apilactobacillus xinyiensis]MCL0312116.1 biotin transporter BioY [Apilactobacillus xinyiensis]